METLPGGQLPVSDEDDTIEQAIRLYGRTLALVDPSRLEAWVGLGLTLTPEGAQSLEEMARTARAYLTEILRQLPREKLERFVEALQDLSQAADAVEKGALASAGRESRLGPN